MSGPFESVADYRDAIRRGDLDAAANVLGRPYSLRGEVIHGAGRGTNLGTPTANLGVADQGDLGFREGRSNKNVTP